MIAVFTLFCGSQQEEDLTEIYPALFKGITYRPDIAYVYDASQKGLKMEFYDAPIEEDKTTDYFLDDSDLQTAIQERTRGLVLDNDSAILAYAWDLQPILQEFSYIPSDFFPVEASRFSNGVVEIIFLNDEYVEYANSTEKDWSIKLSHSDILVFVSEADGHIIHYFSYATGAIPSRIK